MSRGRQAGTKNRNYPALALKEALTVAQAIQDEASGMTVSKLTMAHLIDSTPTSRKFRELIGSSRLYGLTDGGVNAEEFSLTKLGKEATGADEVAQVAALKAAVMNVAPYKTFFDTFNGKKLPATTPLKDFLARSADIDTERLDEVIAFLLEDAKTAGLTRAMKGGDWIDLAGTPAPSGTDANDADDELEDGLSDAADGADSIDLRGKENLDVDDGQIDVGRRAEAGPKKVFIAHGKNRVPLDQLKRTLDQFKVKYAVAVDEPNRGRPISKKVADLMEKECSSGIFIFTADERFLREAEDGETVEIWRPSENVVYELGAASILYDNRIVIFKEKDVSFPSDFSDLGYIEFEKDQLVAEMGNLFSELVSLDILEVRAKA
jgi:predicted nucleotide-binding protein